MLNLECPLPVSERRIARNCQQRGGQNAAVANGNERDEGRGRVDEHIVLHTKERDADGENGHEEARATCGAERPESGRETRERANGSDGYLDFDSESGKNESSEEWQKREKQFNSERQDV